MPRHLVSHRARRGQHDAHPEKRGWWLIDRTPDADSVSEPVDNSMELLNALRSRTASRSQWEPPHADNAGFAAKFAPQRSTQHWLRDLQRNDRDAYTSVELPDQFENWHLLSAPEGVELALGFGGTQVLRGPVDSAWTALLSDIDGRGFHVRKRKSATATPSVRPVQLVAPPDLCAALGRRPPEWLWHRLQHHKVGTTAHLEDVGLALRHGQLSKQALADWWQNREEEERAQGLQALRWLLLRGVHRFERYLYANEDLFSWNLRTIGQRDQLESLVEAACALWCGTDGQPEGWLVSIQARLRALDDMLKQRVNTREPGALYTHNAALLAAAASGAWWARSLQSPPSL